MNVSGVLTAYTSIFDFVDNLCIDRGYMLESNYTSIRSLDSSRILLTTEKLIIKDLTRLSGEQG